MDSQERYNKAKKLITDLDLYDMLCLFRDELKVRIKPGQYAEAINSSGKPTDEAMAVVILQILGG